MPFESHQSKEYPKTEDQEAFLFPLFSDVGYSQRIDEEGKQKGTEYQKLVE